MNNSIEAEQAQKASGADPVVAEWRSGLAFEAAATALLLGSLGNALLREVPWGINVPLWVAALLASLWMIARRHGVRLVGDGRWLLLPAGFFALMLAWRAAESLMFLNVVAVLLALAIATVCTRTGTLRAARVVVYIWALVMAAVHAVAGLPMLLLGDVDWRRTRVPGRSGTMLAVLRGVLLAAPLLIVFGALFAAADPVFEGLVDRMMEWRPDALLTSLFWIGFWTWLVAGWLRGVLLGNADPPRVLNHLPGPRLGGIETATVMGLLNLLFLAFVAVQFRYLFGGADLVRYTDGLGYADYARRGFFELVTASALVLPVLLGLHALQREDHPRYERIFRWLAAALIALLLIVMASALQRMRLYQEQYGLTELRLYTTVFIAWLAAVFAWFAATALRGRRERFAWGALVAAFVALAVLNALNPQAVIARTNIRHPAAEQRLDAAYLARLGPDAVPVLLRALPDVPLQSRCALIDALRVRGGRPGMPASDWRTWNWGRARANALLADASKQLRAVSCAPPTVHVPTRPAPLPR